VQILKANNIPATFFEVGRSIKADPQTTQYVAQNGFEIGNHSWDHSFKIPVMSNNKINQELVQTSNLIFQITGKMPTFFRPPHGLRSPQLISAAKKDHMKMINWSVDPQDYFTGNAKTITSRVVEDVKPGRIILLHDGLQDGSMASKLKDRQGTIAALPQIITQLKQKGYTFVSLETLMKNSD